MPTKAERELQEKLANAAQRVRSWFRTRIDDQALDIARLYKGERDRFAYRLRQVYDAYLAEDPSIFRARTTPAGAAIDQVVAETVNSLTTELGNMAVNHLIDLHGNQPKVVNRLLAPTTGLEFAELPPSTQTVMGELTQRVVGGGTFVDRMYNQSELLRNDLYSTLRQGLINGDDFETVRKRVHKVFGVDKLAEPEAATYGSVKIYQNEARRQWNKLMGEKAEETGGVEYWWATVEGPLAATSTPGCVARHARKISELGGDRPPRHWNCRCTVIVIQRGEEPEEELAKADSWLQAHGFNRRQAVYMEAWDEEKHPRDEGSGEFTDKGGGGQRASPEYVKKLRDELRKTPTERMSSAMSDLAYRSEDPLTYAMAEQVEKASTRDAMLQAMQSHLSWSSSPSADPYNWAAAAALGAKGSKPRVEKVQLDAPTLAAFKARTKFVQDWARKEHGEKIVVYRGIKGEQARKLGDADEVDLKVHMLSSFTTLRRKATDFAGKNGVVLQTTITPDDVFMANDLGAKSIQRFSDDHGELVVMSKGPTRKAKVYERFGRRKSVEEVARGAPTVDLTSDEDAWHWEVRKKTTVRATLVEADFNPAEHPRDEGSGEFTDKPGGGDGERKRKLPKSDDEITDATFKLLPEEARSEEGAERLFNKKLRALSDRGELEFYHEAPGDIETSVKRRGIVGGEEGEGVFAAVNAPSEFVDAPVKTVVRFKVPRAQLQDIVPDMRYNWSAKMSDYQMLHLEHQDEKLRGAYVGLRDRVPPSWITGVQVVRKKGGGEVQATLAEAWDEKKHPRDEEGQFASTGAEFARAGDTVDGRKVRQDVPNRGSISASLTDYDVLPGVREVPFSAFTQMGKLGYHSKSEQERTQKLANAIKRSGEISPLIVVMDKEGPYVLEGGHRFDALRELKAKSFPALVVLDNESLAEKKKNKEVQATLVEADWDPSEHPRDEGWGWGTEQLIPLYQCRSKVEVGFNYTSVSWRELPALAGGMMRPHRLYKTPEAAQGAGAPDHVLLRTSGGAWEALAEAGWRPLVPKGGVWMETAAGLVLDSPDAPQWNEEAVRLPADLIDRWPAMRAVTFPVGKTYRVRMGGAEEAAYWTLKTAGPWDWPSTAVAPTLEKAVRAAIGQTAPPIGDPHLAVSVGNRDEPPAVIVQLTTGTVLHARDPFPPGLTAPYRRAAALVPDLGGVWAVRPRGRSFWTLPGGHIDPGEAPAEAAERETAEETGATVKVIRSLGHLHTPWADTEVFLARRVGRPQPPATVDEIDASQVVPTDWLVANERVLALRHARAQGNAS